MNYSELLKEIYELEQVNLNYEVLDKLLTIRKQAYLYYLNERKYGYDTFLEYLKVTKRLDAALYNKIKIMAPQFSKEAIDNILNGLYSGLISDVDDILVADNNVVIKGISTNTLSTKKSVHIVSDELMEINSNKFLNHHTAKQIESVLYLKGLKEFLIVSISNFLKTRVNNYDDKLCLGFENNKFIYNVAGLNIYLDKDFDEICDTLICDAKPVVKIMAKYNEEEICYFEITIHDAQWIVKDEPDAIWKLSDNINKDKALTYKLVAHN